MPVFYGNSTFVCDLRNIHKYGAAKSWLDGLSTDAVASLRKLYFITEALEPCTVKKGVGRHCTNKDCGNFVIRVDCNRDKGKHSHFFTVHYESERCEHTGKKLREATPTERKLVDRIAEGCQQQKLRRRDLEELFSVLRPIGSFSFG